MNIFEDIQGKRGEILAVEGLRLLIMRSPIFRESFLDLLYKSRIGPISSTKHFACYTEHPTPREDKFGEQGRIDMVVEVDNAIIGIEAKINSALQESQPYKYTEEIERLAECLSKMRRSDVRPFLVVLAPKMRRGEIKSKLDKNKGESFIAWEDVRDQFTESRINASPFLSELAGEYCQFLDRQIDFLPDLPKKLPYLLEEWEERGTQLHRDLVGSVWSLFLNPGPSMGGSSTWVGYYFYPLGEGSPYGWFGFISKSRLKGNDNKGAAFVVTLPTEVTPPIDQDEQLYEKVELENDTRPTYKLLLDERWGSPAIWRACLSKLQALKNDL